MMNHKPKQVRMTTCLKPELHRLARIAAAKASCSLSKFVVGLIEKEVANDKVSS